MKTPKKLTDRIVEYKDGKPFTSITMSEEAKKINEIIDYLEQCENNVLMSNK